MKFNSGHYAKVPAQKYKAFVPALLSDQELLINDPQIPVLLEEANLYLGELGAYSNLVPDIDFFIQMHVRREAATSSEIEGIHTSVTEAAMDREDLDPEKRDDWEEVQNYIRALHWAIEELSTKPLIVRLIKSVHKILLDGVRGHNKRPGEFRNKQNWIGGSSPQDATFVPPIHQSIPDHMKDLEKYWHDKEKQIPELIRVAISHYQFETIHPFEDGNGRTGRLLIILQLIEAGFLTKPALYLSKFFIDNRQSYYDSLLRVSTHGDLEGWVKFFLKGIATTAKDGKETLQSIIDLRKKYENLIEGGIGLKRQKAAKKLLLQLFSKPVVTVKDIETILGVTTPTANKFAEEFQEIGLFKETTGFNRNRIFKLHEYINLFTK